MQLAPLACQAIAQDTGQPRTSAQAARVIPSGTEQLSSGTSFADDLHLLGEQSKSVFFFFLSLSL